MKLALEAYDKSCQYGKALDCNETGVIVHALKNNEKSLTYYYVWLLMLYMYEKELTSETLSQISDAVMLVLKRLL